MVLILSLAACAVKPTIEQEQIEGRIVCDSYIILQMCVRDLLGDGVVDMIYFSDTNAVFMYRDGFRETVGEIMSFHRCAVPLSEEMQDITNQILGRKNLSFREELSITKDLLANYMAAKPEINACNARFDNENISDEESADDFFIDEAEWED